MWNLTTLDTSTTTNRRSYFHSGIAHQASSTARETALSPTLELLSTRAGAPPARPRTTPRTPPHPALHAPSHPRPRHTPHHTPASHPRITPHRATHPTTPRRATRPHHTRSHTITTPKSHVIPPGPHSSTAQKPRNINDPISKPETSSRELRAKLLCPCAAGPGRQHANDKHARRPPRGLRGNRSVAAVLVGGGRARTSTRTPDWRPPRGLRGLAGLRDDAPS